MKNEQIIARAQRAEVILKDDTFQEAMTELRQAITERWQMAPIDDYEQQCELKRLLWAAKQFESVFTVLIANGTVARNDLLNQRNMDEQKEKTLRRVYG